jgi:hypothetical protein
MGPIRYDVQVANPFLAGLQGLQMGQGIAAQQQARQLAQRQAEAQAMAQAQRQQALGAYFDNPSPGARDYAQLLAAAPDLKEQLKQGFDALTAERQRAETSQASQVYAAVQAGRPELAAQMMRDRAAALRNSRAAEPEIQAAETFAKLIEADPQFASRTVALRLAATMDPDKFGALLSTLGTERRADEKQPADVARGMADAEKAVSDAAIRRIDAAAAPERTATEIANIRSQITERAGRLALDQDKLTSDIQQKLMEFNRQANSLDGDAKKIVNDSISAAAVANTSAAQMSDLARQLEEAGGGYGGLATAAEFFKRATGNQDHMSALRQEYVRLRNSQAVKSLPPGPATDKDIELALKGFPSETADARALASFLRGQAKMAQFDAALNDAKAEWVNQVGFLGNAKRDIEVAGVTVPAGTNFSRFAGQFMQQLTEQKRAEQSAQAVAGRSYMRFAAPPASPPPMTAAMP